MWLYARALQHPCSCQRQSVYEPTNSQDNDQASKQTSNQLISNSSCPLDVEVVPFSICTKMRGQIQMLIHPCCAGLKSTREVSTGQYISGGPLISAPQLNQYPLQSGDELLILASDGLWDKVDSKAAVREARRHLALEGTTAASCAQVLVRIYCLLFEHLSHLSNLDCIILCSLTAHAEARFDCMSLL